MVAGETEIVKVKVVEIVLEKDAEVSTGRKFVRFHHVVSADSEAPFCTVQVTRSKRDDLYSISEHCD